jgi:hypothetical protein
MSVTSRRVCVVGILLLIGGMSPVVGRSVAAVSPKELPPIPTESPSEAQPPAPVRVPLATEQPKESPFQEETSTVVEDNDGAEFCGMEVCSLPGRFWLRADYLTWWTSGTHLPPLVTTSEPGTPASQAGVLPSSGVLYGDQVVGNDMRSGFRTTIGMWIDPCHVWGVEFDYLGLGQRENGFTRDSSTGNPILARPFYNVSTGQQDRQLVAYANQPNQINLATGSISVDSSDYFQSAGVLLTYNLCSSDSCGPLCDSGDASCGASCDASCETASTAPLQYGRRTDVLVGFRYYSLSDRVVTTEYMRDLSPFTRDRYSTFAIRDNFSARNDFYGSEIGLRTQMYRGRWSLEVLTKIAVGDTHGTVNIAGGTSQTPPTGATQTYAGGVLATTNIGNYERDVFTMIPQLGLELGYQVNCHWRAYLGYNVLYWGCVSRAADQISLYGDPRNVPSNAQYSPTSALPFPTFSDRTTCFWAQGLNLGTEFRF